MKKVGLISLGCDKNRVDSENIMGLLDHFHYTIVTSIDEADILIINTCGFIEPSKKESIDTILEVITYGKKVVVCGCLAERYVEQLKKEIPEVDLWIPIRDYYRFNELLSTIDDELNDKSGLDPHYRVISTGKSSAYLKIGDGCSNHCSYCAIPLIRGEYHSRPFKEILDEATFLALNGVKEIIVLEQDTTKYGIDLSDSEDIVTLLKELCKIDGIKFIRLLYLYPDEISDELIDLIRDNQDKILPYFDIPIQHSEDKILSSMNRRGDKNYLRNLFTQIRNKIPNAILRTTVMVGFPGENDEDFAALLDFIKEIKFDHLGAFTYSREEDTPSYNYENQIDENIKNDRLDQVMKLQQKISYQLNKRHINEVMEGLVTGVSNDVYELRSYFNAPDDIDGKIYFKSDSPLNIGDIVKVKITDTFVYDLMGIKVK
mgnify:CR=1 FL=1